ncbi:ATP-binding protein [Candidatus Sumerlaeota bacterium]|nr:ATP-binding protein [Candidatus Sumerlaeota bacterium]
MTQISKGKSPFYPGQPVPIELFAGRENQLKRIVDRGVQQVAAGKPVAIFVQGEYGIGKSSFAGFVRSLAEARYHLHGIYASLGGARNLEDVAQVVLNGTVRSGTYNPKSAESMRDWFSKYVDKLDLFGFSINMAALRRETPDLTSHTGMIEFLSKAYERLKPEGIKGIFLILDEINGITANPEFAHFIKGLVESNAMSPHPLPLLLMLCGVEEKRREMIHRHEPVDRIFDVIEIEPMNEDEMSFFFKSAFESVGMTVKPKALQILTRYSAGFPKIMHLVGDMAFWQDNDGSIDEDDALNAVLNAADEVGRKYVDQQVYKALRSPDYLSILTKIGNLGPSSLAFANKDVASRLTESERKKFNNFLQKMKQLKVLRSGDIQGEYTFNMRMVQLYIWLQSSRKKGKREG